MKKSILVIYTGGTIGMAEDSESGSLVPLDFENILRFIPELKRFNCRLIYETIGEPVDSSEMNTSRWNAIGECINARYHSHDGFVILHGTDTMAYTASALSFMFEGLSKPIIITGSQLPLGRLRTDGKENLISAIEIANACSGGSKSLGEVAVFFGSKLMRGNRTHKYSTEYFDGIVSDNYPVLAEAGVNLMYRHANFLPLPNQSFVFRPFGQKTIFVLKIFPGIKVNVFKSVLQSIDGLLLESYGSGNIPSDPDLFGLVKDAKEYGVLVANVSQCNKGFVEQGRYKTGEFLRKSGVCGAADMTSEAALTKMMYLLSLPISLAERELLFAEPLRGELTTFSKLL